MKKLENNASPSVADLLLFEMSMFQAPNREELKLKMFDVLPENRRAAILAEKEKIEQASTPDEVIQCMRKSKEMFNRPYICDKALALGDEIIPAIIRRWKTSSLDFYIENAAMVLSAADEKYVDQLVLEYDDFRHPYAIGVLSILLAFRKRVGALPAMYRAWKRTKGFNTSDYESGTDSIARAIEMLEDLRKENSSEAHNTSTSR